MTSQEEIKTYEKTIKPLFKKKKYGLISDVIHRNPELKKYLSYAQTRVMMDYYENLIYDLAKGLEKLTTKFGMEWKI
jgi:hypothetical protein